MTDPVRQRLNDLRNALLHLHKTLVDSERDAYENAIGKIQSPNHFLQLLTSDPWFAWLHPLSELIVSMDETLEAKDPPASDADAEALFKRTGDLLVASEEGVGFSRNYFDALQGNPDVVMAHADAVKFLGSSKH